MYRGFAKIWRKIEDEPWYKRSEVAHLAVHLLIKAAHEESSFLWNKRPMKLEIGQIVTGQIKLSQQTGISRQSIRTSLNILSNCGFLTIKSTNKFSLISICNSYCNNYAETDDQPANQPSTNHQLTINQPSTNHIQELRELKRTKKNIKNTYSEGVQKVMDYLNEKTGKKFRNSCDLVARFKEGYTVEDAFKVIDNKMADDRFQELDGGKFMRPATLFSKTHFDDYLNQNKKEEIPDEEIYFAPNRDEA